MRGLLLRASSGIRCCRRFVRRLAALSRALSFTPSMSQRNQAESYSKHRCMALTALDDESRDYLVKK